jgi:hypothetical protein
MLSAKWRGVVLTAAIIVSSALARLPYLNQANLSPDAADYINIARNLARGRGLIHTIKWHFFTADGAVHSAVGERPLLYPLALVPFCRGDYPARACQYVTVLMAVVAIALGAAWARRLGLGWGVVAISAALVAFNPGLLMCSVFPWTEPLYLVWLFAILLVVDRDADSRRAARVAALLTVLAWLTRPSAAAIALGLCVWYAYRRAFAPLANYVVTLLVLLIPWFGLAWAVRGEPFYSIQGFHAIVEDIRDGMAAGYGTVFPRPIGFLSSHMREIALKIVTQTVSYLGQLFGPTFLSLLGAFVFLRAASHVEGEDTPGDGPCFPIALVHFILPAMTWATFDAVRFMLPCFAVLAVPAVAEMDRLIGRLGKAWGRGAAWLLILGFVGFFYADQWGQLYARVTSGRMRDLAMQVARMELDQMVERNAVVACADPFSINYYFDRPAIVLPEPPDATQRLKALERFLDEYRPDYVLLSLSEAKDLAPLITSKRLAPTGALEAIGLQLFRVRPPAFP